MENYTWTISALDCKLKEDGLTNVIENVHWRFGNDVADTYGVVSLPSPIVEDFIKIDNINKQIVTDWLISIFSIKAKKNNPIIEGQEEIIEYEEFSRLELMIQDLDAKIKLINTPTTVTRYL